MKALKLITIWKGSHKTGHYVPMESHNQYELVYYRYGMGLTRIGDKEYNFSPNTFVFIPPHVMHDETHYADCELIFIRIQSDEILPVGIFTDKNDIVYNLALAIQNETRQQNIAYKDMIEILLNELIIFLERFSNNEHGKKQNKSFEYIINYLKENYQEKIHFQDLARQMNFSYDYFQHRFKEITGYSPQQFLIHRRIEAAQTMLTDNSGNCTEIAQRCGFSNSAQFSALFKRETGYSPQQWRKK